MADGGAVLAIAARSGGMTLADLRVILAGFAVLVLRALLVLARPTTQCGRCHGNRTYRKGKRLIRCNCIDGRRYRLGAVAVHRFWWLVLGERLAENRRVQRPEREDHHG